MHHEDGNGTASGAGTGAGAYVTATAVTTRTATTHEDLGKNAKTQQLEEKTVATTTTHNLNRQEQRVVTQEVKTTATVTSGEQVGFVQTCVCTSSMDHNHLIWITRYALISLYCSGLFMACSFVFLSSLCVFVL